MCGQVLSRRHGQTHFQGSRTGIKQLIQVTYSSRQGTGSNRTEDSILVGVGGSLLGSSGDPGGGGLVWQSPKWAVAVLMHHSTGMSSQGILVCKARSPEALKPSPPTWVPDTTVAIL